MEKKYIQPRMQKITVTTCQMIAASDPQARVMDDNIDAPSIEGKERFDDDDDAWTNGLW
ncbi:MAG: hypothetical protein J1F25_07990 [Prevotellaceae bacterium]|nr:hypothetical protein [Prevotellaceae bacterium]